ncbi:efflux RND transporter periplasmic adaptor subunit [Gracilimonas sp.]|uniref:efflux RND transporter periplasmic adaptor subunit n=1 Tax=Gracilimonas sp. TaxID=1974203 RepID=UPI0032F05F28
MKRILIIAGILIALGLLAYPKLEGISGSSNNTASNNSRNSPLSVDVYVVQPDTIEDNIFTTGTLLANEEVELASESSGLIEEIYLKEGQSVEKGELLIKINDSELRAQLNRADFRLNLAEDREKRQTQLLEKGGISQEEYDATLNEVNVLRAEVALIEAQIAKTEIRAPFSGKIGLKYVSDGSYITPSTRIATLQDIDPIKIDFSIPERYAAMVEVGNKVEFTVSGMPKTLTANVYAKEPRIDTETRSLQVRAKSPNTGGQLLPGAFADLELTLSTINNAMMVPSISLVPELQGQKVYVVENGTVQPKSVQTGLRNETKVQITEGVAAGDTVLTTGLLQVRPGMAVNIGNVETE